MFQEVRKSWNGGKIFLAFPLDRTAFPYTFPLVRARNRSLEIASDSSALAWKYAARAVPRVITVKWNRKCEFLVTLRWNFSRWSIVAIRRHAACCREIFYPSINSNGDGEEAVKHIALQNCWNAILENNIGNGTWESRRLTGMDKSRSPSFSLYAHKEENDSFLEFPRFQEWNSLKNLAQ